MVKQKLTAREEAFCQAYASGLTALEAYKKSYRAKSTNVRTLTRSSQKVATKEHIKARIAELREKVTEKTLITVESLTAMLLEDRLDAKRHKQTAAAVSALQAVAKLHGYDKASLELTLPQVVIKDLFGSKDES